MRGCAIALAPVNDRLNGCSIALAPVVIEALALLDIAILHRARHEADSTSPSEQGFQIFTCTSLESEWLYLYV